MKTRILTLILLHISSANGQLDGHIIGGDSTSISKFPFQISLRDKEDNVPHECGGTIITEKFVVTAAHCCKEAKNPILNHCVYAGSALLDRNGTKYDIDQAFYHKNYNNKTRQNDICLLMIKGTFHFNNHLQPAKIICRTLPEGTVVQVTGWGSITHPGLDLPNQLYETHVSIVNLTYCKHAFVDYTARVSPKQICTMYKNNRAGTCLGDSGGPMSYKGKLVGLISFGLPCVVGKPDVNLRVASYVGWIKRHMDEMCKSSNCSAKAKDIELDRGRHSLGSLRGYRKKVVFL